MDQTASTKFSRVSSLACLGLLVGLGACDTVESFEAIPCVGAPAGASGCESNEEPSQEASLPSSLGADLQATLDDAVANAITPGAGLSVSSGQGASWSGAAGLAELEPAAPMLQKEQFRAGSVIKTFVATAVLQKVEAGALGLDDVLTERLPPELTRHIPNASSIDVRMLLGHRSGIYDWDDAEVDGRVGADPEHIWSIDEIMDRVAAHPAVFSPDERYGYSNTNYILLGEIISALEGRGWREVVREQVFARAGLEHTFLPEPGDLECPEPCAHGYIPIDGALVDFSRVDPSMAGASGGHALITTPADLSRFLRQLRNLALFERPSTLDAMFEFQPGVETEFPQVGYGFGMMQMQAGELVALGHIGGTAGYQAFMLYVPATDRYVSGFMNVLGDFGALLMPVLERVATP